MKKNLVKIALLGLVAAAFIVAPGISRAQDSTNMPTATTPAPKKNGLPFHGKIAAVDAAAMTFTVGTMTINVTSTTKISKDGQKAAFTDLTVGENVTGSYKKDEAGKLNATTVRAGQKKKAATTSN